MTFPNLNFASCSKMFNHYENILRTWNKEFQSADVLLFCETWLTEEGTSSDDFEIEGFRSPAKVQGWNTHRGLMTYSKQKSRTIRTIVNENFELMQFSFTAASLPYSIIVFYRSSSNDLSDFIASMESIIQDPQQKNRIFVIMGDANLDLANATDSVTLQYGFQT